MKEQYAPSTVELAFFASDALYGKVTSNMRSISCEMRKDKLFIQIVFERQPEDHEMELISLFEAYFISGMYGGIDFDHEIIISPSGYDFSVLEVRIYGRFEGMEFT